MNPTDSPRRRKRGPGAASTGPGAASGAPTPPPQETGARSEGLPRWADALLTLWVVVVAVVYFGGYFWPEAVGVYAAAGRTFYAALLLVAAVSLTLRYLNRGRNRDDTHPTRGHAHED